jgi:hypothetical protein
MRSPRDSSGVAVNCARSNCAADFEFEFTFAISHRLPFYFDYLKSDLTSLIMSYKRVRNFFERKNASNTVNTTFVFFDNLRSVISYTPPPLVTMSANTVIIAAYNAEMSPLKLVKYSIKKRIIEKTIVKLIVPFIIRASTYYRPSFACRKQSSNSSIALKPTERAIS